MSIFKIVLENVDKELEHNRHNINKALDKIRELKSKQYSPENKDNRESIQRDIDRLRSTVDKLKEEERNIKMKMKEAER